jgi:hypothetical protein
MCMSLQMSKENMFISSLNMTYVNWIIAYMNNDTMINKLYRKKLLLLFYTLKESNQYHAVKD